MKATFHGPSTCDISKTLLIEDKSTGGTTVSCCCLVPSIHRLSHWQIATLLLVYPGWRSEVTVKSHACLLQLLSGHKDLFSSSGTQTIGYRSPQETTIEKHIWAALSMKVGQQLLRDYINRYWIGIVTRKRKLSDVTLTRCYSAQFTKSLDCIICNHHVLDWLSEGLNILCLRGILKHFDLWKFISLE
jgi:hypothetical protein